MSDEPTQPNVLFSIEIRAEGDAVRSVADLDAAQKHRVMRLALGALSSQCLVWGHGLLDVLTDAEKDSLVEQLRAEGRISEEHHG